MENLNQIRIMMLEGQGHIKSCAGMTQHRIRKRPSAAKGCCIMKGYWNGQGPIQQSVVRLSTDNPLRLLSEMFYVVSFSQPVFGE